MAASRAGVGCPNSLRKSGQSGDACTNIRVCGRDGLRLGGLEKPGLVQAGQLGGAGADAPVQVGAARAPGHAADDGAVAVAVLGQAAVVQPFGAQGQPKAAMAWGFAQDTFAVHDYSAGWGGRTSSLRGSEPWGLRVELMI